MRSGCIPVDNGHLRYANATGYNWSLIASPRHVNDAAYTGAYNFVVYATGVNSSGGPSLRWFGFPLHCTPELYCYNFVTTSLYFVRSGIINIGSGRLRNAGVNGFNWSRMASSRLINGSAVPSALNLYFNATGVTPSNGPDYRWNGFPLCWLT